MPGLRVRHVYARRGFTLIDLMVAMAVLAVLAITVMPSTNPEAGMKLISAATVLATDIEYAQSATLAEPDDHTVIVFDIDGGGYYLAKASAPMVPIVRPGDDEDYVVRYGVDGARTLEGVGVQEAALLEPIEFDAFGSVVGDADRNVVLFTSVGIIRVDIRKSTGSVAIVKP